MIPPLPLPEVHNHLLSFADVKGGVVVLAPCSQVPYLLSVFSVIIVGDETQDGGVIRKLKDDVGVVSGHAITREQGVQQGTEYAALRGSDAQGQCRGGEVAHSHHLGSTLQEVQDPVAQGGVKTQGPELGNKLSGHNRSTDNSMDFIAWFVF